MTYLARAQRRLRDSRDLDAVLDAAYEAFEAMLVAIRAHEDPGWVFFSRFTMAAALAADGRDAIAFAPSIPPPASRDMVDEEVPEQATPERIARLVSDLSQLAMTELNQSAGQATDPADQDACDRAARCAAGIHDLLAKGGP
jgi:hypothetical protein